MESVSPFNREPPQGSPLQVSKPIHANKLFKGTEKLRPHPTPAFAETTTETTHINRQKHVGIQLVFRLFQKHSNFRELCVCGGGGVGQSDLRLIFMYAA